MPREAVQPPLIRGRDAVEVALEARGGADEQSPRCPALMLAKVWGTPRGAKASSPAPRVNSVVPELEGELAFEDVERLVEVMVMELGSTALGGGVDLDHGDLAAGLLASQQDLRSLR